MTYHEAQKRAEDIMSPRGQLLYEEIVMRIKEALVRADREATERCAKIAELYQFPGPERQEPEHAPKQISTCIANAIRQAAGG